MTGVTCAMAGVAGGFATTMTVGSTSYTAYKVLHYEAGFVSDPAQIRHPVIGGAPPLIGSLANTNYKGYTVTVLQWNDSTSLSGTTGSIVLEITGSHSAGFVNDVTVDGVSLGTPSAGSYSATYNTTAYTLGTTGNRSNPFGTSGTKNIVIT